MAKIQISTVRMMCNAQVINLNAYFVAKATRLATVASTVDCMDADRVRVEFENLRDFVTELTLAFEEQAKEQKPNKYDC